MRYAISVASVITMIVAGCTFYTPSRNVMVVQMRHDEAYYAGFFRACEMIIQVNSEGIYSYVQSRTNMLPRDQCAQLTQMMIDANAAHHYSHGWPGMDKLSLRMQTAAREVIEMPH